MQLSTVLFFQRHGETTSVLVTLLTEVAVVKVEKPTTAENVI